MKTLTLAALLCAITALTTAAGERHVAKWSLQCSRGWYEYGGSCYIYIPQPRSWAESENYCVGLGANLASIHSLHQHRWLRRMIATVSHGNPETWIGGSDCQQERMWLWSDGSPFNFRFWGSRQPDYRGEHCILMNWEGLDRWDDYGCSAHKSSVCAKKI